MFFGGPAPTPLCQPGPSERAGHSRHASALRREAGIGDEKQLTFGSPLKLAAL